VDIWWAKTHPSRAQAAEAWAIPEAIVMCESKDIDEPPNSAGASGYYQIIPSTWSAYGGSPPDNASEHSRAEQSAVAARIWDGGAGAGQWECKA
jgi:Transglycosylase-like domain